MVSGSATPKPQEKEQEQEVESFAATGIDNALDLLEVVTAKMDKASVGSQAAKLEAHPEVCPILMTTVPVADSVLHSVDSR